MEIRKLRIGESAMVKGEFAPSGCDCETCRCKKVKAAFDEHKVKQWIKENPMNAENLEDLEQFCCDHFEIDDDADADKVYKFCKELQRHLPR